MEHEIAQFYSGLPNTFLIVSIGALIAALVAGAHLLVEEAVTLSVKWGVSKVVIGATIVSLGTTLPEAAVSVLAAIQGEPGLALGNAVGSIICDTGLILGIATLITPLPLVATVVGRTGRLQIAAGFLLVLSCLPYSSIPTAFTEGGRLPQFMGFVFVALLIAYLWLSIRWAGQDAPSGEDAGMKVDESGVSYVLAKLIAGVALVVIASRLLIPAVQETAMRAKVPESIIAATLVAFGTSLPELVTAVTAACKGHGELAVGNVIGADILNVLFVTGAAASVTPGGLHAPSHFFCVLFPAMLGVLIVFRIGVVFSKDKLKRPFGVVLLVVYVVATLLSYAHR